MLTSPNSFRLVELGPGWQLTTTFQALAALVSILGISTTLYA
jgi:hypothetical protein